MNILALDLGTKTGYAYNIGVTLKIGTWTLATPAEIKEARKCRMDRRLDIRVPRLYKLIRDVFATHGILRETVRFVVFEDVQFVSTTMQVQLWSSLRAAVWLAASEWPSVQCECVPVGTLKKFTTTNGSATKGDMAKWLFRMMPERLSCPTTAGTAMDLDTGERLDDNALDALAVWRWALTTLSRTP